MTNNQIILFSFITVVAVILISGSLVKIYRNKKAKNRTFKPLGIKKIEFELKGDIFELEKLAIILDDLERYQIPVKTILELNIIIEEVFTGIVNHMKQGQQDQKVLITLTLEPGIITVCIKDYNEEFNPTVVEKIDLNAPIEEISFQGLGFHLVRKLADHLSYQRLQDRNILTIIKTYTP